MESVFVTTVPVVSESNFEKDMRHERAVGYRPSYFFCIIVAGVRPAVLLIHDDAEVFFC